MKEALSSAHQKRFMACLRTPGPCPLFINTSATCGHLHATPDRAYLCARRLSNKNGGKYEVGSLSITPRDVSRALRSIAGVSAL